MKNADWDKTFYFISFAFFLAMSKGIVNFIFFFDSGKSNLLNLIGTLSLFVISMGKNYITVLNIKKYQKNSAYYYQYNFLLAYKIKMFL